ncbi:hypothetical protein B0T19DRAFT_56151 [Cercophora scortea]|uniref:Uncharacterized protein n=1 Tax=Cercophora scortea TaxID=314031 RepID=A0AAE0J5J2_9PEZI|nr:hypothetical protein B0T19DRAFT_56151 [Cercophora scortea]
MDNRFMDQPLAKICKVRGLDKLPKEVMDMIWEFSPHALFWRSISTIARLPKTSEPLRKIPLDSILSWERGGSLVTSPSPSPSLSLPPYVRLTVDLNGICKVERLPKRPVYNGDTTESLAFVVEHTRDISNIDAEVKDGLVRLRLPRSQPEPRIWNTPSPPDFATCTFRPVQGVFLATSTCGRSQ